MKYLIIVCDGMTEDPAEWIGEATPLEKAHTPYMDLLFGNGYYGLTRTIPNGMDGGSDVGNLAILGYPPKEYYHGRATFEAASVGVTLTPHQTAFRGNFVTLSPHKNWNEKQLLHYNAGGLSDAEGKFLAEYLQKQLPEINLYHQDRFRCCLVEDIEEGIPLPPAHDYQGGKIAPLLTRSSFEAEILVKSHQALQKHPLNLTRQAGGIPPVNGLWLWGAGKSIELPAFSERTGLNGGVITVSSVVKGIAFLSKLPLLEVKGATGDRYSNLSAKKNKALQALADGLDLVYLHIDGPDEHSHRREPYDKQRAIEEIDRQILRPLLTEQLPYPLTILLLPDHGTSSKNSRHLSMPVPYLLYRGETLQNVSRKFCERSFTIKNSVMPQDSIQNASSLISFMTDSACS